MTSLYADVAEGAFLRGTTLVREFAERLETVAMNLESQLMPEGGAVLVGDEAEAFRAQIAALRGVAQDLPNASQSFDDAMRLCFEPPADEGSICAYCRGQGTVAETVEGVVCYTTCPFCTGTGEVRGIYRRLAELDEENDYTAHLLNLYRLLLVSPVEGGVWDSLHASVREHIEALDGDLETFRAADLTEEERVRWVQTMLDIVRVRFLQTEAQIQDSASNAQPAAVG